MQQRGFKGNNSSIGLLDIARVLSGNVSAKGPEGYHDHRAAQALRLERDLLARAGHGLSVIFTARRPTTMNEGVTQSPIGASDIYIYPDIDRAIAQADPDLVAMLAKPRERPSIRGNRPFVLLQEHTPAIRRGGRV